MGEGTSLFALQSGQKLSCEDESNTLFSHLSCQVPSCSKATEVDAKGNQSLKPWHFPTCKGQIVFPGTQQRKQCPQTPWAGRWLAPFSPFPQSSSTHASEDFEERVDGASGASRRGGWGGRKAMSGLVFPHHPQKAPPSLRSLLTRSTNETPWDPKIAPLTAAQHPFIA